MVETASRQFAGVPKIMHTVGAQGHTRKWIYHCYKRVYLASFLVRTRTDPKTVQKILRHSNVNTTLQLYAQSVSEDRMTAQALALAACLQAPPANDAVN